MVYNPNPEQYKQDSDLRIKGHGTGGAFRCRCCGSIDIEPVPLA